MPSHKLVNWRRLWERTRAGFNVSAAPISIDNSDQIASTSTRTSSSTIFINCGDFAATPRLRPCARAQRQHYPRATDRIDTIKIHRRAHQTRLRPRTSSGQIGSNPHISFTINEHHGSTASSSGGRLTRCLCRGCPPRRRRRLVRGPSNLQDHVKRKFQTLAGLRNNLGSARGSSLPMHKGRKVLLVFRYQEKSSKEKRKKT